MSVGLNGVSARQRKSGIIVLAVVGGIGLLFALTGAMTTGVSGFLVGLGLTVLVIGVGAVVMGRPGWALIGSRKVGAGVLALGLILAIFGGALAPATSPKVVAPQALVESIPTTSETPTSPSTTSSSASPTPTVDPAAAAVVEANRVAAEAAAAAQAETDRIAAAAAASAQAAADRVATQTAVQAEADRVAAQAATQAEADRQARAQADQQAAQRTASANTAPSGEYANCAAARAAGAAPVLRGQPGYAPKLDRDDDGVGCEN